jgi:hypothetical protein
MAGATDKDPDTPKVSEPYVSEVTKNPKGFVKILPTSHNAKLATIAGFTLLLIGTAGAVYYLATRHEIKTELTTRDIAEMPTEDYDGMTKAEAAYRVEKVTGHSITELQSQPIDDSLLKNFNAAYSAARGLARVGDMDHAFQAYAVADKKAKADNYAFHLVYGYVAADHGKMDVARQQVEKAKTAISKAKLNDQDNSSANSQIKSIEYIIAHQAGS